MKRVICLVLAVFVLCCVPVSAVEVIEGSGNDDGEPIETKVTRADAVRLLCKEGHIEAIDAEEEPFSDVPKDYWAYGEICAAKEYGFIEGVGDGRFEPDRNVTNEEFIKMLVCLLRYEPYASGNGGYPTGYLMTAANSKINLTEGVSMVITDDATLVDILIMIMNAQSVPLMIQTYEDPNTGAGTWQVAPDEYTLTNGWNVKTAEAAQ